MLRSFLRPCAVLRKQANAALDLSVRPALQRFISSSPPKYLRSSDDPYGIIEDYRRSGGKSVGDVNEQWRGQSEHDLNYLERPGNAFTGRTVDVRNGDVASAYRTLNFILHNNKVWSELRMNARHEKKGAKRRRLSSERWRRRFKEEVRSKVWLVKRIVRRGA